MKTENSFINTHNYFDLQKLSSINETEIARRSEYDYEIVS